MASSPITKFERVGGVFVRQSDTPADQPVNPSGVQPLDMRVVVQPDSAETKIGSIIIPESVKEQQSMAAVKGTLIAAGANAWQEAAARAPGFRKPIPGDRIMFAKYGGVGFEGSDKGKYRIMNDEDIVALLEG